MEEYSHVTNLLLVLHSVNWRRAMQGSEIVNWAEHLGLTVVPGLRPPNPGFGDAAAREDWRVLAATYDRTDVV